MKKMNKKGQVMAGLQQFAGVAVLFLIIGVVFTLALVIEAKFQAQSVVSSNAEANAAIAAAITATAEIPTNWLQIVAIVIAASLVLTIIVVALVRSLGGGFFGGAGR